FGKPQARHNRHVLDLEFVAIVRALAVVEIEDVRQALLLVILWANVFFLVGAVGARAFASVVTPANEIVVIGFFADAREIRGKRSALHLVALTDGVAGEAAAHF